MATTETYTASDGYNWGAELTAKASLLGKISRLVERFQEEVHTHARIQIPRPQQTMLNVQFHLPRPALFNFIMCNQIWNASSVQLQ